MSKTELVWYKKVYVACKTQLWRIPLALGCLALAVYCFLELNSVLGLLWINAALNALTIGLFPQQHYVQPLVSDVLAELKLEQDVLHVQQRQLKVDTIKKVAVDQLDKDYAFIDFPFNVYRATAMRFPAEQLPAVKTWLQQHLPQAEIIR